MYKIRDYPYVTLRNALFFPGAACRLDSPGEGARQALKAALSSDNRTIAIFSTESEAEETGLDDLYPIGVLASARADSNAHQFEADVVERVRLRDISHHPHPIAQVEILDLPSQTGSQDESDLDEHLRTLAYQIFERGGALGEHAASVLDGFEEDQRLQVVYFLATVLPLSPEVGKAVLAADVMLGAQETLVAASEKLLALLRKGKGARPALREVLWTQADFGEEEEEEATDSAQRLRDLVEDLELAPAILDRVLPELEKMDRFDPVLFEHQDTLGRLEGLVAYPWHVLCEKLGDLDALEAALDQAVMGHAETKEGLLDLLAMRQLNPKATLPMLCLAGPSGVGKRTLLQALARATGRPLETISLAGPETGESPGREGFAALGAAEQLRGQPRNLPGSAPGAIYEAAVRCGSMDPVLLLQLNGPLDAGAARVLLELANGETSSRFHEAYLGLPIDASSMLKVVVVEDLAWLPRPLRDSVVVLEMEGFTRGEKRRMARERLWPAALRRCGLRSREASLEAAALSWLVEQSARSAGVLELSKALDRLARRLARLKVSKRLLPPSLSLSLARSWLGIRTREAA